MAIVSAKANGCCVCVCLCVRRAACVCIFYAVFAHVKATFTSVKTSLFMNAQGYSNEET